MSSSTKPHDPSNGQTDQKDKPLQINDVLRAEYAYLYPSATGDNTCPHPANNPTDATPLKDFAAFVHKRGIKRSALCLSGGGIRSATFSLGVIQALANLNLLEKFDYLSTVSGGGYIGGWLTTWIHRDPGGIQSVQTNLKTDGERDPSSRSNSEPPPLTWLRDYSNYLTPMLGLFSADSWTLIGTFLRNLILNWLVIVPLLVAAFMLPRLQTSLIIHGVSWPTPAWLLIAGLVLCVLSLFYLHYFRPSFIRFRSPQQHQTQASPAGTPPPCNERLAAQGWFLLLSLAPLVLSAYCLTTAWAWYSRDGVLNALTFSTWHPAVTFAVVGAACHGLGWLLATLITGIMRWRTMLATLISVITRWWTSNNHWKTFKPMLATLISVIKRWWTDNNPGMTYKTMWYLLGSVAMVILSGALGGFFAWKLLDATPPTDIWFEGSRASTACLKVHCFAEWYAAFAVPGFLVLFLLAGTLFIGITARFTGDQEHEFWARTGGWALNSSVVLGGLGAVIIFGPGWVGKLGVWASASLGGIAGILSLAWGFSAKTLFHQSENENRRSRSAEFVVKAATPVFVILLIVGLALSTSFLVRQWTEWTTGIETTKWTDIGINMPEPDAYVHSMHGQVLHNAEPGPLFAFWVLLLSISLFMSLCTNINKFSLHGFYRNRLIRAYLGASRGICDDPPRKPHPLTGFDRADNPPMTDLRQRPFHIVNIALNLVRPGKLAWQQRKAQSFTISPLHCGSWDNIGYRPSNDYGYNQSAQKAVTLGTAVAISGAAASPNMGYHSSPAVTFLLTLFNIRLGWWLGNPGEAGGPTWKKLFRFGPSYRRAHPAFAIRPLLSELFGRTDADNRYVYLSDGGHFENLGLYEMVLRRCHHIVVVDASCDRTSGFEDLGNAIRKIRIDLGVEIDISTDRLLPKTGTQKTEWHHAIGTIRYDTVDPGAQTGTLVYLKPSLSGDEPSDVREYATQHDAFPHEPTSDQFFDESQFESYRRLGEHIGSQVFTPAVSSANESLAEILDRLEQHWLAAGLHDTSPVDTHAMRDIDSLLGNFALEGYARETYPELTSVLDIDTNRDMGAIFHSCASQVRTMERVFRSLDLNRHAANPNNMGWMGLFQRWAETDSFRRCWPVLAGSASPVFVDWAERHLDLSGKDAVQIDQTLEESDINTLCKAYSREHRGNGEMIKNFERALRNPFSGENYTWLPNPVCHVARLNKEIVGVLVATKHTPPLPMAKITLHVYGWVGSGYRHTGLHRQLCNRALNDVLDFSKLQPGEELTMEADCGDYSDPSSIGGHRQAAWVTAYTLNGLTPQPSARANKRMILTRDFKHA